MVKEGAGFLAPALVNHAQHWLVLFKDFFNFVGGCDRLKRLNEMVALTCIEQWKEAVMTTCLTVEKPVWQCVALAAKTVDQKGQGDLIKPWVEFLQNQLGGTGIEDGQGIIYKPFTE